MRQPCAIREHRRAHRGQLPSPTPAEVGSCGAEADEVEVLAGTLRAPLPAMLTRSRGTRYRRGREARPNARPRRRPVTRKCRRQRPVYPFCPFCPFARYDRFVTRRPAYPAKGNAWHAHRADALHDVTPRAAARPVLTHIRSMS
jgi:hypothetical protein